MSKVVILTGSPSASSRLNGLTQYLHGKLSEANIDIEVIQVIDLPPEDLVYANFGSSSIVAANEKIATAQAVIIASPVYKASFTGVLKSYIDLLPQKGFEGKLIAPIFIAGTMAHLLSIDYSLKPVLASMGARHFTKNVYTTDQAVTRTQNEQGEYQFSIEEEVVSRLDETIEELIAYLNK